MHKRVQNNTGKPHTLIGSWVNCDEYNTEVEYIISPAANGFAVRAVDRYDSEEGEVYDAKWDGNELSFAVHWKSTGRFIKARLLAISPNRVSYTYTYTQNETWVRKGTKRKGAGS